MGEGRSDRKCSAVAAPSRGDSLAQTHVEEGKRERMDSDLM
jgi:hypothetical protein